MSKYKTFSTIILTLLPVLVCGQQTLTLQECRERALRSNNGLKMAEEKKNETDAMKKAALWQMLPKVSANGTISWMEKSVQLLSDEQKDKLNNLGPTVQSGLDEALREDLGTLPIGGEWIADRLSDLFSGSNFNNMLNQVGGDLVNALETDTRNMIAGVVTVTQPLFMGGKLHALYRTASLMAELSGLEYDKRREDLLIGVDEAYWQVVSVKHKKELAEQYAALLDTLNRNVEEMVAAEVATKGDLTKVRVKLNEAQMSLTKATNGLALSKMLLAQRCGMPLDTVFDVASDLNPSTLNYQTINMDTIWAHRKEMRMLRISDSVAQQGVRIARSTLLPNIALTGGYLMTSPNLFNGFQNELGGTFLAGVVVNVPILHPGGMYSLKAAKAKRREVGYQMAEARELIELQVNKVNYELELAYKKLAQAESNLSNAEENLKLADESFKAGMAGSTDLMAAQTAWVQAKGDVLDAQIEIEMSKLYLKQAMGE